MKIFYLPCYCIWCNRSETDVTPGIFHQFVARPEHEVSSYSPGKKSKTFTHLINVKVFTILLDSLKLLYIIYLLYLKRKKFNAKHRFH